MLWILGTKMYYGWEAWASSIKWDLNAFYCLKKGEQYSLNFLEVIIRCWSNNINLHQGPGNLTMHSSYIAVFLSSFRSCRQSSVSLNSNSSIFYVKTNTKNRKFWWVDFCRPLWHGDWVNCLIRTCNQFIKHYIWLHRRLIIWVSFMS